MRCFHPWHRRGKAIAQECGGPPAFRCRSRGWQSIEVSERRPGVLRATIFFAGPWPRRRGPTRCREKHSVPSRSNPEQIEARRWRLKEMFAGKALLVAPKSDSPNLASVPRIPARCLRRPAGASNAIRQKPERLARQFLAPLAEPGGLRGHLHRPAILKSRHAEYRLLPATGFPRASSMRWSTRCVRLLRWLVAIHSCAPGRSKTNRRRRQWPLKWPSHRRWH